MANHFTEKTLVEKINIDTLLGVLDIAAEFCIHLLPSLWILGY